MTRSFPACSHFCTKIFIGYLFQPFWSFWWGGIGLPPPARFGHPGFQLSDAEDRHDELGVHPGQPNKQHSQPGIIVIQLFTLSRHSLDMKLILNNWGEESKCLITFGSVLNQAPSLPIANTNCHKVWPMCGCELSLKKYQCSAEVGSSKQTIVLPILD